ncbi:MAG: tripartite tricarboxylate transporter substrate binding protein [Burkholderiales bacterium]|nr:tripartite tricarboxylate transporter substrate binding protein [Burkholderiales bacterium]
MNTRRKLLLSAAAGALAGPLAARAQAFPVRPVRLVVAAAAGGGDDIPARLLATKMSEVLGQQMVVENRPGAGGAIGQNYVAKAAPDGYTLLLAGGSMAGAHYVNANLGYDLQRDFTPISLIETVPWSFVAGHHLPARTVREFIAHAKSQPGKLTFGTLGPGQIPYWAAMLFNRMAGIDAVEVAYKSIPDALVDLMAGRLDYCFPAVVNAAAQKDKLRVLATTGRARSELLPEVPTMIEAGLPNYEMPAWRSVMGPAGMRREVVEVLNKAMVASLAAPDLRERLVKTGSVPTSSTPEELRQRYLDWSAIFGRIARDAGLKPQ